MHSILITKLKQFADLQKYSFILLFAWSLSSCSTSYLLSDNEYLVKKMDIEYPSNFSTEGVDNLETFIKQRPNRKVFVFFPFHLFVYNAIHRKNYKEKCTDCLDAYEVNREKDEVAKELGQSVFRIRMDRLFSDFGGSMRTARCRFRRWGMETVGEAPVIYSEKISKNSAAQISQYLKNEGFFRAKVTSDTTIVGAKKVAVKYFIEPGEATIINGLSYKIYDPSIDSILMNDAKNCLVKKGMRYDLNVLDAERDRITALLRNKGYFKFSKEYIRYKADTLYTFENNVNLTLEVLQRKEKIKVGEYLQNIERNHQVYNINKVILTTDYDAKRAIREKQEYTSTFDTIQYEGYYFAYQPYLEDENNTDYKVLKSLAIKPEIIFDEIYLGRKQKTSADSLYILTDVEKTYQHLSALRIFKIVNIQFEELSDSVLQHKTFNYQNKPGKLNCHIQLTPASLQSITTELEGSNFSSNFGMAGSVVYQHRNLFRSATNLSIKVKGAREKRIDVLEDSETGSFNTLEYGFEARLTFPSLSPQFLFRNIFQEYKKTNYPKTYLTASYNYLQRPDYTRDYLNFGYGYGWRTGKYFIHNLNVVEFNTVELYAISSKFSEILSTKPSLRESYEDHVVAVTNYSFLYNEQEIGVNKSFPYVRFSVESSGNLLRTVHPLFAEPDSTGSYTLLNKVYTQFLKTDIDLRYYKAMSKTNTLVFRFYGGLGLPYGNKKVLPFGKKYYSGGANSIRAWPVRGIGPGSHADTVSLAPNQAGDLKLEANFEYRQDIYWMLESAIFIDAGNVWDWAYTTDISEGKFELNKFYKQIAVGAGAGLRFDFTFFVFRADVGIKIFDPSRAQGHRWLGTYPASFSSISNYTFSIGYPF